MLWVFLFSGKVVAVKENRAFSVIFANVPKHSEISEVLRKQNLSDAAPHLVAIEEAEASRTSPAVPATRKSRGGEARGGERGHLLFEAFP